MKIISSTEIQRRPRVVFSWFEDLPKSASRKSGVSKTENQQQIPEMVGTTFGETIDDVGRGIFVSASPKARRSARTARNNLTQRFLQLLDLLQCVVVHRTDAHHPAAFFQS